MKFTKTEIGSSVSCSGACLTIEKYNKNLVKFYVSKETLNRTIFKSSKKGDIINLEKPLKYGNRISGHFVQGHVDTTCFIEKIHLIGKSWLINFKLLKKYSDDLNLKELSMGMSSDFNNAVINGSTFLRLGTIIMGERNTT